MVIIYLISQQRKLLVPMKAAQLIIRWLVLHYPQGKSYPDYLGPILFLSPDKEII